MIYQITAAGVGHLHSNLIPLFFVPIYTEQPPLNRRDTQGNNIGTGERYKLHFRDKVQKGTAIADVHLVESYKKYNQMDVEEETTFCKCTIF